MKYDKRLTQDRVIDNTLKAKEFFKNKKQVHALNIYREWYNGFIVELGNIAFKINDRKLGIKTIYFSELWDIEELEEENEVGYKR